MLQAKNNTKIRTKYQHCNVFVCLDLDAFSAIQFKHLQCIVIVLQMIYFQTMQTQQPKRQS